MGHEPTMDRRALELRPATNREAHKLGMDVGDQVWSVNGPSTPTASRWLCPTMSSPRLCYLRQRRIDPARSLSREQLGNGSVFAELEARGLMMVRSLAEIHAVSANALSWIRDESATMLYLLLDQLHVGKHGEPILYSRTYFVEGKFQFVILRTR